MEERCTPEMFVNYFAGLKGLCKDDLDVAPVVVLSWNPRIIKSLAEATGAELLPGWIGDERYPLYNGEMAGRRFSLMQAMVGAPCTVMEMEQLHECGAQTFVGVGYTGSLQPSAPIGNFVIPTECLREEGTSAHYLALEEKVRPSLELLEMLQESCRAEGVEPTIGPLWTTDAPFRETISKITDYAARGIMGVDMETSAMYALGQYRGVQVCNLLMVSDELWHEWRIAFRKPELNKSEKIAEKIILHFLSNFDPHAGRS
jgi:uridine phosphorylase